MMEVNGTVGSVADDAETSVVPPMASSGFPRLSSARQVRDAWQLAPLAELGPNRKLQI